MPEPRNLNHNAYIIEFKVHEADNENTLQDTVNDVLAANRTEKI